MIQSGREDLGQWFSHSRNVLADYVFELRTVDPSADGNWSFAPISADVNVTMISAPNADKALGPGSPIEKIGVDSEGFGRYRIRFGN